MAEKIKFTELEIKKINDLRLEVTGIFTQLGQVVIERKKRLNEIEEIESKLVQRHGELVDVETNLFKELNTKYGDGNYDPETGTFTPLESEPLPDQQPQSV